MSAADTLRDLAARVEAATGPDQQLDAEMWLAATPAGRDVAALHAPGQSAAWAFCAAGNPTLPRYTASLDAAMALIPAGWAWMTGCNWGEGFFTSLAATEATGLRAGTQSKAATAPLALTAAALRAQAETPSV